MISEKKLILLFLFLFLLRFHSCQNKEEIFVNNSLILSISLNLNSPEDNANQTESKMDQIIHYPKVKLDKNFIYISNNNSLIEIERDEANFKINKIGKDDTILNSKIIVEKYIKNEFNEKKEIFKTFNFKGKNIVYPNLGEILDFYIDNKNQNLFLLVLNSSNKFELIVFNKNKEVTLHKELSEFDINKDNIVEFQVVENVIFFIVKNYLTDSHYHSIYQLNLKTLSSKKAENIEDLLIKEKSNDSYIVEVSQINFIQNSSRFVAIVNFVDKNTLRLMYKKFFIFSLSSKKKLFYQILENNLKHANLFVITNANIYLSIPINQKENIWNQRYFFKIFNLIKFKMDGNKIINVENKTNDLEKWLYITNDENFISYSIRKPNLITFYYNY